MKLPGTRKRRTFNFSYQLEADQNLKKRSITFDRLPRKKVRSIWWLVAVFFIVILLYKYLHRFL